MTNLSISFPLYMHAPWYGFRRNILYTAIHHPKVASYYKFYLYCLHTYGLVQDRSISSALTKFVMYLFDDME